MRAGAFALTLALAACGPNRPSVAPLEAVEGVAERTRAEGTASFSAGSQDATLEGTVDLHTGKGRALARSRSLPTGGVEVAVDFAAAREGSAPAVEHDEVARALPGALVGKGQQAGNPLVALDLLGRIRTARSFGGVLVRGAATFRYEVVLRGTRFDVPSIPADVWMDDQGRARRIQLGNDLNAATTTTDRRGLPDVTTLDLYAFGDS